MISLAHAVAAEAGSCKLLLDGVSDCCWMTGLRSQYFVCRIPRSASDCLGGLCYPQCVHFARKLEAVVCCLTKSVSEEAGYSPTGGLLTSQNTQGHFQSRSHSPVLIHFAYTT